MSNCSGSSLSKLDWNDGGKLKIIDRDFSFPPMAIGGGRNDKGKKPTKKPPLREVEFIFWDLG
jgi:hypothetical protein